MKNLALEMRPKNLSEIYGQQTVISALQNHLILGNTSVGYIFSGPTGTGKTTLAHILVKELYITEVVVLNAADENGIDSIRKIVESAEYRAFDGGFRAFILEEAQQLTIQAQNVLLPVLEKKDLPSIFIFTTTEPQKLLKPLRDRCLSFALVGLSQQDRALLIEKAIQHIGKTSSDASPIISGICQAGLYLPREIINAVEGWANGLTPEQAVQSNEAEFIDIARLVFKFDWYALSIELKKLKNTDSKALRQVISGYGKTLLLTNIKDCDRIAVLLRELALYQSHEPSVDFGALVAILSKSCQFTK